jgi:hypothetical protein
MKSSTADIAEGLALVFLQGEAQGGMGSSPQHQSQGARLVMRHFNLDSPQAQHTRSLDDLLGKLSRISNIFIAQVLSEDLMISGCRLLKQAEILLSRKHLCLITTDPSRIIHAIREAIKDITRSG